MREYNVKKIIVLTTHHNLMLIEKIFASFDTNLEVIYELHNIMDCFVRDWHFGILIDNDYIKSMSNLEKPMLEVKSGATGSLRSLHLFLASFPACGIAKVFSDQPYSDLPEQNITILPLYSAFAATKQAETLSAERGAVKTP